MDFKAMRQEIIQATLDFVYPPLCLGCGVFTEEPFQICKKCLVELDEFHDPFCFNCKQLLPGKAECFDCRDKTVLLATLGHYSNALVEIIAQYKFHGITQPSELFAKLLSDRYRAQLLKYQPALLVPIPLHPTREKERGYNQAGLLAQHIAANLNISLSDNLLYRVKKNHPQAKISLGKRAVNIADAFYVDEDVLPLKGTPVILIDDVTTSGHTLKEAINTLALVDIKVPLVLTVAQAF